MISAMIRVSLCGLIWVYCATIGSAQDASSLIVRIKAVGKEGVGNVEAAKAWKELVAKGPSVMPEVLAGMDDASPIAVNWLRAAVEAIQDKAGKEIPAGKIDAFLKDTRHAGRSRRLAYECLVRLDPTLPDRLLPKLLNDPSSEIRRDAVAQKLKYGLRAAFDSEAAQKKFFLALLQNARDRDQVDTITAELKKLGVKIDLTKHFGFITHWHLAASFDNSKGVGFNNVYPPEKGVDLKAVYQGKKNEPVRWKEHTTDKKLGVVDFHDVYGNLHGTVAYGYTVVTSAKERPVELRAGSNNAVRIWLNGKEVYFREEYHHGMEMDQHVGKGMLKAGPNAILIKVCQNEQTDSWAQQWSFQLRVCDALGAAVPLK